MYRACQISERNCRVCECLLEPSTSLGEDHQVELQVALLGQLDAVADESLDSLVLTVRSVFGVVERSWLFHFRCKFLEYKITNLFCEIQI